MSIVPNAIKQAYHRRRLCVRYDNPDRTIVDPNPRYIPAPTISGRYSRARRLAPVWVSSYTDNGSVIVLGPYRELYDDPSRRIRDLSDWYATYGDGHKPAKRGWEWKPEPRMTKGEIEAKRREVARALFPKMPRRVRKLFFSLDVQNALVPVIEGLVHSAILDGTIRDCKADRDDYARTIQYMMYAIAAKYEIGRPGKDNRGSASLVTFIRDSIQNRVIDMRRTRYALKRMGNLFVVPIEGANAGEEGGAESAFAMVSEEIIEDPTRRQHDSDEILDIEAVEKYLTYVARTNTKLTQIVKAFNLLVYDDLSYRDAAKEMKIPEQTFKDRYLEPLRRACRRFGFAPKCK